MLAQIVNHIPPAFNTVCERKIRSIAIISSVVVGSVAIALLISALQPTSALPVVQTDLSPTRVVVNSSSIAENSFYARYSTLESMENLTGLLTLSFAFVIGLSVLATAGLIGMSYLSEVFARTTETNENLQTVVELIMLALVGSIIGIAVEFLLTRSLGTGLSQLSLSTHLFNVGAGALITVSVLIGLKLYRNRRTRSLPN